MNLNDENEKWEGWITFNRYEEAFVANCAVTNIKIYGESIQGALCEKAPPNLDTYRPADWNKKEPEAIAIRRPKPPQWLAASTKENSNYFKLNKFLEKKVGSIKSGDITRFGKKQCADPCHIENSIPYAY